MKAKELKIYGITLTKILLSYSIFIIFILKYKILFYNFKVFELFQMEILQLSCLSIVI